MALDDCLRTLKKIGRNARDLGICMTGVFYALPTTMRYFDDDQKRADIGVGRKWDRTVPSGPMPSLEMINIANDSTIEVRGIAGVALGSAINLGLAYIYNFASPENQINTIIPSLFFSMITNGASTAYELNKAREYRELRNSGTDHLNANPLPTIREMKGDRG